MEGIPSHKITVGQFHIVQLTLKSVFLTGKGLDSARMARGLCCLGLAGALESFDPLQSQHGPEGRGFAGVEKTWGLISERPAN